MARKRARKKRYAGLIGEGEQERIVFKGLESARTDWTPLAQKIPKHALSNGISRRRPE